MKCKKCQNILNKYLDKEIPKEQIPALETHISSCSDCSQLSSELSSIKTLLHNTPTVEPNPFLWTRIRTALEETPPLPIYINAIKIFKIWVPVAFSLIIALSFVLRELMTVEANFARYINQESPTLERAIKAIPATPENLERIAINTIVYRENLNWKFSNGEVNHVGF